MTTRRRRKAPARAGARRRRRAARRSSRPRPDAALGAQASASDRPGDPPREGHDRDHRVDPDPGREQRAVGDVEARGRRRARRRRSRTLAARVAPGGPRSPPIRAVPIWWAENTLAAVRGEVEGRAARPRRRRTPAPRRRVAGRACRASAAACRPRRSARRPGGPGELGHRHERVAERRDAGRVELVVDPDAAGSSSAAPGPRPPSRVTAISGAIVARRTMSVGVGVGALPRQRERHQARDGPGADSIA